MPFSGTSIVDNRDDNTLLAALQGMGEGGRELWIATAFFSLDALQMLAGTLESYERVRILFGDDANARQRLLLLQRLRRDSDRDLLAQRDKSPLLPGLALVERLFAEGRIEARCYTAKKFHAKSYLMLRNGYPALSGLLGSGNFTRPGLQQNIELNAMLTPEQATSLQAWYEDRWAEAVQDEVTSDVLDEIRRQIELYDPYWLYLKALYLWGQDRQAELVGQPPIVADLDAHQLHGFLQALTILEREHGVMVCDGVGLGKSYIALAIMQHYCRSGKRVLLLAPKNILSNSWDGYISDYLSEFQKPFGSIEDLAMTALGFDPDELYDDGVELAEAQLANRRLLEGLADRADLVVIDESHNFRTSSANRYQNLWRIIEPRRGQRKDVVLMTATPINTAYVDVSNQLSLITHDGGRLAGYAIEKIRLAARESDKDEPPANPQLSFDFGETADRVLQQVFEQTLIQRSRATCKELSRVKGRELHFPIRRDPECIDVAIGPDGRAWRDLIATADRLFRPGVTLLTQLREETDEKKRIQLLHRGVHGIKLSAFLTEQYRRVPQFGGKVYRDEIRLAELVYTNTLKQLESSPVAFQGILQSLGAGLLARLRHVLGEEGAAAMEAEHTAWVRRPLFGPAAEDTGELDGGGLDDVISDGDALDQSGGEHDAWMAHLVRQRGLTRKLAGFNATDFDVERWARDIEADLRYLREIHVAAIEARRHPDPKLEMVLPRLRGLLAEGRRVLVFTQSQRTAEYLERELRARLQDRAVARIDSRVETTRASIIHAFCPAYNKLHGLRSPSVPERIDVLVSTDVLSEGVNLQEAGAIVNYDVHWNPVRLIQRIGRVDRRLNPALTPTDHDFRILNVLPPDEIESIINLVGTIEGRKRKISRALGLDQSFFRADDPAGTLKEFNALYDGTPTAVDQAQIAYLAKLDPPDEKTREMLERLPPGSFGVWSSAPCNGLFALFEMRAVANAPEADLERFGSLVGRPVLALQRGRDNAVLDAGEILGLLAGIPDGERSGMPSDEAELADGLKRLRNAVRQSFAEIELPRTVRPELVCWIELRQEHAG